MRQDWLPYAMRAVPRYTSYPTAVQFSEAVGAEDAARWSRLVAAFDPISVYVHVPFCEQLCWYCGCHTNVANGYARIADYVEHLHREIDLRAAALGPHGGTGHLHFGGGSPNALSAEDFFAVAEHVRTAFQLLDEAEFAVELDPRSITPERVSAMAASGVTRASLGVQTLSETVQKAVNRVQPRVMVEAAADMLREAGVDALNMDLMYGLPHQTVADAEEAARFAVQLSVDRVAVFGYAHVPWFAKHQRVIEGDTLPGLSERFQQAEAIARVLLDAGYVAVGLDHFAKPIDPMARAAKAGTLRRNFQGYTTDPHETLVALGPSAISAWREGFAQNAKDMREWREAVAAGELAITRGVGVTDEDRLRARVIEVLMCRMEVDLGAVCAEMGAGEAALDGALDAAHLLAADGLCTVDGRIVRVPEDARILLRTVAQCFDAYTPVDAGGRHAKAV